MKQFYTHGAGSSIKFQRALTLETIDQISTGSVVFTWGGSAQIDVWIRNKTKKLVHFSGYKTKYNEKIEFNIKYK